MSMKSYADPDGHEFTASSPESANKFAEFTSSYMGFRRETGAILKEITEADPDMPMARCAKG